MMPILKRPSAWVPIVLSLIALTMILVTIAIAGIPATPPKDEGTGAHLFQLWMVLEVLMILFFAIKWLPQTPKQALQILALQVVAALAACAPVFLLGL
jgi:hypothetical protein